MAFDFSRALGRLTRGKGARPAADGGATPPPEVPAVVPPGTPATGQASMFRQPRAAAPAPAPETGAAPAPDASAGPAWQATGDDASAQPERQATNPDQGAWPDRQATDAEDARPEWPATDSQGARPEWPAADPQGTQTEWPAADPQGARPEKQATGADAGVPAPREARQGEPPIADPRAALGPLVAIDLPPAPAFGKAGLTPPAPRAAPPAPPAPPPPLTEPARRVLQRLDALAALVAAPAAALPMVEARHGLADALRILRRADLAGLHAALAGIPSPLFPRLAEARPANQARLTALGTAERISLARSQSLLGPTESDAMGALLAITALVALPALPAALAGLATEGLPARLRLMREVEAALAPAERATEALDGLAESLRQWRATAGAEASPRHAFPLTAARAAAEPWRADLAPFIAAAPAATPAPAAAPPGRATRFRNRLQVTLPEALAPSQALRFTFRTEPDTLRAEDWCFLADGQPLFTARERHEDGSITITLQALTPLAAGTAITGTPPAGEYFCHYTPTLGVVWPPETLASGRAEALLVLTALAEPCLEGFHKPEHLPAAIGRWMSGAGTIRLPLSPAPLRAVIRGRHRLGLLRGGGLLAMVAGQPIDLLLEPLGEGREEDEWLLHAHLPPTIGPGGDLLRLFVPDLPPRPPEDARDTALIFLAIEVTPLEPLPTERRRPAEPPDLDTRAA